MRPGYVLLYDAISYYFGSTKFTVNMTGITTIPIYVQNNLMRISAYMENNRNLKAKSTSDSF